MPQPSLVATGRSTPSVAPLPPAVFGCDVRETPPGSEVAFFALGCFWGAEKLFWTAPGVTNTAVGYAAGTTPNPTYEEVCSGLTNHAEVVRVCFDPVSVSYAQLVQRFFEAHDPTQGMRQGNDIGTQYRSMLLPTSDQQAATARTMMDGAALAFARHGHLTTEVAAPSVHPFYYAEPYHQQYLHKNPHGYCPSHSTGIACPLPSDAP